MASLRGCPCCPGFMRWDQLSCNECNGTNSRESYRQRTATLATCLYMAAVEEMRVRAALDRLATATAIATMRKEMGE